MIIFKVAFKMKNAAPQQEEKKMLEQLTKVYKNVPGLKLKYFVANPKTGEAGGIYLFENQEFLDKYLKSDVWRTVVLDNSQGAPTVETLMVLATTDAGVLL